MMAQKIWPWRSLSEPTTRTYDRSDLWIQVSSLAKFHQVSQLCKWLNLKALLHTSSCIYDGHSMAGLQQSVCLKNSTCMLFLRFTNSPSASSCSHQIQYDYGWLRYPVLKSHRKFLTQKSAMQRTLETCSAVISPLATPNSLLCCSAWFSLSGLVDTAVCHALSKWMYKICQNMSPCKSMLQNIL